MIKTFRYTTDSKNTYGVYDLDLQKGDIFKLIDTKLSCIKTSTCEEDKEKLKVYIYEHTIYIPKHNSCHILCDDVWYELIAHCDFVDK